MNISTLHAQGMQHPTYIFIRCFMGTNPCQYMFESKKALHSTCFCEITLDGLCCMRGIFAICFLVTSQQNRSTHARPTYLLTIFSLIKEQYMFVFACIYKTRQVFFLVHIRRKRQRNRQVAAPALDCCVAHVLASLLQMIECDAHKNARRKPMNPSTHWLLNKLISVVTTYY